MNQAGSEVNLALQELPCEYEREYELGLYAPQTCTTYRPSENFYICKNRFRKSPNWLCWIPFCVASYETVDRV